VSVGLLPPKKSCVVSLKCINTLLVEKNTAHFSLPIGNPLLLDEKILTEFEDRKAFIDLQIGVEAEIEIHAPSSISEVKSNTHSIRVFKMDEKNVRLHMDKNSWLQRSKSLDFRVTTEDCHLPRVLMEEMEQTENQEKDIALVLSLLPDLETQQLKKDNFRFEIILLVDRFLSIFDPQNQHLFRSGSMSGHKMTQTKNMLHLFLRSLPEVSFFFMQEISLIDLSEFTVQHYWIWKQI
jgi:hypothetical protein